jgi:hypothetical protein
MAHQHPEVPSSSDAVVGVLRLRELGELVPPCEYLPFPDGGARDCSASQSEDSTSASSSAEPFVGLFLGQLPTNTTSDDICTILHALATRSNVPLSIREVAVFSDRRSCAFAHVNASAMPLLLSYHRRIVKDGNGVWIANSSESLLAMNTLLGRLHRAWSTSDSRSGILPPKQPMVIEEMAPQRRGAPPVQQQHLRGGGPTAANSGQSSSSSSSSPGVSAAAAPSGGGSFAGLLHQAVPPPSSPSFARCARCSGQVTLTATPLDCPLVCDRCHRPLHPRGEAAHICQNCLSVACMGCFSSLYFMTTN